MIESNERQKMLWGNITYSIQRIDLLIVSVSGAGVYFCLEALKFMYENEIAIGTYIKSSAGLFITAIILNFISQFFSFYANLYDYKYTLLSDCQDRTEKETCAMYSHERISNIFNKSNNISTALSVLSMFAGLIICFAYFASTF